MNTEQARKSIASFIAKRGYTYTVDELIPEYVKSKTGSYVSYTAADTIKHCAKAFQALAVAALGEQHDRENQQPLTMRQLRERNEKYVWMCTSEGALLVQLSEYLAVTDIMQYYTFGSDITHAVTGLSINRGHIRFYDFQPKEAAK